VVNYLRIPRPVATARMTDPTPDFSTSVEWVDPHAPLSVDVLTTLQRRLVYEVSGASGAAAVLFADHPPGVTIGREGSRADVPLSDADLTAHNLPLHFVPRGGGTMLHLPGQVTCFPVLPIGRFDLSPGEYVRRLLRATASVATAYTLPVEVDETEVSLRIRGRRFAHVGVAVRNGVTLFGVVVNVCPDLEPFRFVRVDGDPLPMTSLQRECTLRITPHAVRQKLLNAICDAFGLRRTVAPSRRPFSVLQLSRHAYAHRH
jgi:lipoyl(octanoyl) transferase